MTIISSNHIGFGKENHNILNKLSPQLQFALRRLLSVICPPTDHPQLCAVITGAFLSVIEFGSTLSKPSKSFIQIQTDLKLLSEKISELSNAQTDSGLNQPLFRRLTKYPAWSLFLSLSKSPENSALLIAAGAEFVVTYEQDRLFAKGYANNLRLATDATPSGTRYNPKHQLAIEKRQLKVSREARSIFESDPEYRHESETVESFELRARHYLVRNQIYASPRHRQSVLDHGCQSIPQLIRSSNELRERAVNGEHIAILTSLAFCCGLSVKLSNELPLDHACEDWFMSLDITAGLVKTNIAILSPDSATPSKETTSSHHSANKIAIKPLPSFLAVCLSKAFSEHSSARTVGELLPDSTLAAKALTISDSSAAITPSIARFLNSAASFAVQNGIDRLTTAIITNDFSVIPGSKLYYGQVDRDEIWQASHTLFKALKWGEPVNFVDGLAVGSEVIPTREAVANLFKWMAEQTSNLSPGKRYTLASTIAHHNSFANYCASFTTFCLACRQANEFEFTATSLNGNCSFTSLADKKTGQFPGALPVPVNRLLSKQLELWFAHCRALNARLENLGFTANSKLHIHVDAVINQQLVKLFFHIADQVPIPIGSSNLTHYWPAKLKLNANFGRDFWERELRLAGILSSKVDMMLRHQMLGMESYSSTSHIIQRDWGREICGAQEELLGSLKILPITGLAKH